MYCITDKQSESIGGGNALLDLWTIAKEGWGAGNAIYNSLSYDTQNTIGGTIDQALYNIGVTDTLHDPPR